MSFSDDDKQKARRVVRKKKSRNPLRTQKSRSTSGNTSGSDATVVSSTTVSGSATSVVVPAAAAAADVISSSSSSAALELLVKSDRFANDLARLIQSELAAVCDKAASEQQQQQQQQQQQRVESGASGANCDAAAAAAATAGDDKRAFPRGAEALRRSAESPHLRRVAALNASPRRFAVDVASAASATGATAASTPTRSTDSSPRVANAGSGGASGGGGGGGGSVSGGANSSDNSPRSPRVGRSLFSRLSRMASSPRRGNNNFGGSNGANSGGGAISAKQFLADDASGAASPRHMACEIVYRRCIGGGGMAKIYEAEVKGLVIAVKVYNPVFAASDEEDAERRRLVRKLEAVCALPEHRNVLSFLGYRFESWQGGARLVAAMTYVPTTLHALVQQRRRRYYGGSRHAAAAERLEQEPFARAEVLGLFSQIVAGVCHLHAHGIWHRDLKSENVLAVRCDYENAASVFEETVTPVEKSSSTSSPSPSLSSGRDNDALLNKTGDGSGNEPSADDERGCDDSDDLNAASDDTRDGDDDDGNVKSKDGNDGGGNFHRTYCLKLADFDEIHVVDEQQQQQQPLSPATSSSSSLSSSSLRGGGGGSASQRRLSLHCGTLQYCAPETFDAARNYDERIDIWSLGMILYTLLTLELPFARENLNRFQLQSAIETGQRPSLPAGYLDKWPDIVALFFICTERCADLRPNASTLLAQIQQRV